MARSPSVRQRLQWASNDLGAASMWMSEASHPSMVKPSKKYDRAMKIISQRQHSALHHISKALEGI